jgi:ABC-type antimicrobial peptide transport system permease subunit
MSSLLFGIEPTDPATFAVASISLLSAAAVSSYLPARRAAAVNPVEALRSE